jgi:hypothetical protein
MLTKVGPSYKLMYHVLPFAITAAWLLQIGPPHVWEPLRKGSTEGWAVGF